MRSGKRAGSWRSRAREWRSLPPAWSTEPEHGAEPPRLPSRQVGTCAPGWCPPGVCRRPGRGREVLRDDDSALPTWCQASWRTAGAPAGQIGGRRTRQLAAGRGVPQAQTLQRHGPKKMRKRKNRPNIHPESRTNILHFRHEEALSDNPGRRWEKRLSSWGGTRLPYEDGLPSFLLILPLCLQRILSRETLT